MWKKTKSIATTAFEILKAAGKEYGEDRVGRMSAAVAYRAIFAFTPLFILAVAVFGLFLGGNAEAETRILDYFADFAGPQVVDAVGNLLGTVEASAGAAGVVGFALLLWTSSSLFMELQNDLNDIFHVPYEHTTGVVAFITKRGIGFLFALGLGLVLIAVTLLNTIWNLLGDVFPESFAPAHELIGLITPLISLLVLPFVIALSFQVLSRVSVRWRAIWWGSFFTTVAFLAASYGASLYFRISGPSAAGVAGSIFIILLLAFVLSSVFLFGAEVTKVYNDYLEKGIVERPNEAERFVSSGEEPDVVVAEPSQPVPVAAVMAFLSGLFVGWWRRR